MIRLLLPLLLIVCVLVGCTETGYELEFLPPTATAVAAVPATETPATLVPTTTAVAIDGETATVDRVIDGDTIDVWLDGDIYRVRYIGVDTPERDELFYEEATAANRQLVEGQVLTLVRDVSETDPYGRLLRNVYLADGTFVNARLIEQGYAQVVTFPPDVSHHPLLLELQEEARTAGVGLWASEAATSEAATSDGRPTPTNAVLSQWPDGEEAKVNRIIDGDTIDVWLEGDIYRVRYIGVDTPERDELFYEEATAANRQLVEGQTVILVRDVSETDPYGRLLRNVYLADGTFVNARLIEQGYAQVVTFPPDVSHHPLLLELQDAARAQGLGLWGD